MKIDPAVAARAVGRDFHNDTRTRLHRTLGESPTFGPRVRDILGRQPNDVELGMLVTEIAMDLHECGYTIERTRVGGKR